MSAQPEDIPSLADLAFSYLSHVLPSPIYSFVERVLSHAFSAFSAGATLFHFLISTDPEHWNLQTVLPPLISLIVAYLALLSIYRTTTWMIRTVFWFIKWGTILGVLIGGASYMMGNTGPGVMAGMGALLLDILAQQNQNTPYAARSAAAPSSRSRTGGSPPRSWDSFEQQQAWRAQNHDRPEQDEELRKIVQGIVSVTEKVLERNDWWSVAKGVANELRQAAAQGNTEGGDSSAPDPQ